MGERPKSNDFGYGPAGNGLEDIRMTNAELQQLELFAQVDELLRRLRQWNDYDSNWEPFLQARALLRRLLPRLDALRIRLEAPLVVATFGGTGTGKSSLVNALVGQECTKSGRERPTTRRPVLLKHPQTELEALDLPASEFDVVAVHSDVLRDIVIVDCPDPDTNEADAGSGSNLAMLRSLLPHCDVLLYTSTQQKYRSARVLDELNVAATGCRLLFVQTHSDHDVDIRADWRSQLADQFAVPEMFFVDSARALREQQAGQRPSGEFARLQDFLSSRMAAADRVQIRRANLLDLIDSALKRCVELANERVPAIERLKHGLTEHQSKLTHAMSDALREQLQASRHLWEQRLLSSVTARWGVSPFATMLRVYGGLGALIASASLARARSTAQLVLLGAMHGTKWLADRSKERSAESRFEELASLGVDESLQREARLILGGYLFEAKLDPQLLVTEAAQTRGDVARLEADFLSRARERVDAIIARVAKRNSGFFARCWYELLFAAYLGYVLWRAGKGFFYDSLLNAQSLPNSDFYLSALIFFGLWSSLLLIAFANRLRRGLDAEIKSLAQQLADERMSGGQFPRLEAELVELQSQLDRLQQLAASCEQLRRELAVPTTLGAKVART